MNKGVFMMLVGTTLILPGCADPFVPNVQIVNATSETISVRYFPGAMETGWPVRYPCGYEWAIELAPYTSWSLPKAERENESRGPGQATISKETFGGGVSHLIYGSESIKTRMAEFDQLTGEKAVDHQVWILADGTIRLTAMNGGPMPALSASLLYSEDPAKQSE